MMRMSFGGNHQGGLGNGGGGGLLRTVARVVTRAGVNGVKEPYSSSSSSTTRPSSTNNKPISTKPLSLSSSTSIHSPLSSYNSPISVNSTLPTWPLCSPSSSSSSCDDEFEWVSSVDGYEDERKHGFFDEFVLGSVPSMDEIQNAVSSLQQVSQLVRDSYGASSDMGVEDHVTSPSGVMRRISSVEPELDWIEPSVQLCNSRMSQSHGANKVFDAFHLLQTDPSVQRMVISLSSDKAVWDAILCNEVVQELRESFCAAAEENSLSSVDENSDGSNAAMSMLKWIFDKSKAKAIEVIEMISKVVNQLLQAPDTEKTTRGEAIDPFDEKLRSSFLLTIVVLLIVVVTRAHGA